MVHILRIRSTLQSWWEHPDLPVWVLSAIVVAAAVWLRAQDIGFPPGFRLDEHHFVNGAHQYLRGLADDNDHPPLGKMVIALAIRWVGDGPVGWRAGPLAFGLLTIPLVYLAAQRCFRDRLAGSFAALFVAIDGCFIAYSRVALLDGILVALMLGAVALVLSDRPWSWVAAGLVLGLAVSVKISAITLALPLVIAVYQRAGGLRKALKACAGAALGCLVVYWGVGALAGLITHDSAPWLYAWTDTRTDLARHIGATARAHPMTSRWYTWFLPSLPVTFGVWSTQDGMVRVLTMLGNPLLWWGSTLAILASAGIAVRYAWRRSEAIGPVFSTSAMRSWGLLVVLWIAPLLPWIASSRDSYAYHYMPTYAVGLIALAGLASRAYAWKPRVTLAAVCVVVVVSAYYAPVWGELPIGYSALDRRLFLWR